MRNDQFDGAHAIDRRNEAPRSESTAYSGLAVFAAEWSDEQQPSHALAHPPALEAHLKDAAPAAPSRKSWILGPSLAAMWAAAAIGAPVAYWGLDGLANQHPAIFVGLAALAAAPAALILWASRAARDAAEARAETRRFAQFAEQAFAGAPAAREPSTALVIAPNVHGELVALDAAVDRAMDRLAELEDATKRNVRAFDNALVLAKTGGQELSTVLARELDTLATLNAELRSQTDEMGGSVSRQVRIMREASRLMAGEVRAAEDALSGQLESFTGAAQSMALRTGEMNDAADKARAAACDLDETMGKALTGLSQAAELADASRQTVETAAQAASDTASAVREATARAISEARRAAQIIRAEAQEMEESAHATLSKLHEAAAAARAASDEAEAAAEKQSISIQRRLTAMAETVKARTTQRSHDAEEAAPMLARAANAAPHIAGWHSRANVIPAPASSAPPAPRPAAQRSMGDVMGAQTVANDVSKTAYASPFDLADAAGLVLSDVFSDKDLERIAGRAKFGAATRRRGVCEISGRSVDKVAALLLSDPAARDFAEAFRRDPSHAAQAALAAGRPERDVTSAYLIIDAALG
jgi:hypothetical protein